MGKEYIEREAAKERLRIWITDCVLDGDNEAADCFRDCIDLLDSIPAAKRIQPGIAMVTETGRLNCSNRFWAFSMV